MNARFISRVRVLTACIVLVGIIIIGRLYMLQIVQGKEYTARSDAQFMQPASPLLDRDSIYFTDKNGNQITAATLKSGFTLALNPTKVVDANQLYQSLQNVLPLVQSDFLAKATKQGTQYAVVATHLDTTIGQTIQAKQLPGVVLAQDRWRYYPGASLAAREIGVVAYNGDTEEGRYGLESEYQDTLDRSGNNNLYSNFFVQLFGAAQGIVSGKPQSGDIITTIEPAVQAQLEGALQAYDDTWHPDLTGGIIMDPQTGDIYAMAVEPTFDLNNFSSQTDPLIFANPMVQNIYEMGSIMKPLTMAAGIDSGAITPTTTYDDTGCITVDKSKICNYDLKARGVIPMQQILSQSLNVGASFVATQMGSSTMRDYFLNHYDLGQETGIDLPGEVGGLVKNLQTPRQIEYDTASYGQGIAVTPIETIRALATLSNGGYLVTPHFVKSIHYDTGLTKTLDWPKTGPVLQASTTAAVSEMLTTVVDTVLAHGAIKLDHYTIAAKTGTAQIENPATGTYYTDSYLHSYFGYMPTNGNARFIIFLFAVKPVGAPYASETWSSTFHGLTQFLINYYNVAPDR